jgi:hypothetical protein
MRSVTSTQDLKSQDLRCIPRDLGEGVRWNAWPPDVQPLLLVGNRQSSGVYVGIQAMLVCCASKMINGGMAVPGPLTHSIAVIHPYLPNFTFRLDFSRTSILELLDDERDDSV